MSTIRFGQTLTIAKLSATLLLTGMLTSCGLTQTADSLVAEARKYHNQGNNKAAVIQLKNAVQKNADDADIRYFLGTVYLELNDLQSAEKETRKAMALGMPPDKAWPQLGRALLLQGKHQVVLDETALSQNVGPEILVLRGSAYAGRGKFKEAKESYNEALKAQTEFPDALVGLARIAVTEKDMKGAERLTEQAISHAPKHVEAQVLKADLLRLQGKAEMALAAYEEALRLNPHHSSARLMKVYLEIDARKFIEAKADLKALRNSLSNALLTLHAQATLDYTQGNYKAAQESLQQMLRAAPEHLPSMLLAGAVAHALGSNKQAEQHLVEYLQRDPQNLNARKLMISVLLKSQRVDDAQEMLGTVIKEVPHDVQALTLAGESQMQKKNYSKAADYFEQARKLAPEAAVIHTALGMSKLELGQRSSGAADLEKAAQLDPKSIQNAALLVATQIRLKEYDKAHATVNTFEKHTPNSPLVQQLRGNIYRAQNEISKARSSYQKAVTLDSTYFPAVSSLAQLDLQENKPDVAIKRFQAVLEKDPKHIAAMTALANIALARGQTKEGTHWLERARNENPDSLQPAMQLAAHYLRLGEKQKSLELAQKILASNPENTDVLNLLAQIQLATHDRVGALESYARIASLLPDSPIVFFRIAVVQLAMQNQEAAAASLRKALTLKPDYLDAQLAQASLEASKGNHDRAVALAREIQKQHKSSSAGHTLEGDLMIAQNKPELAVKAYEQALLVEKQPRIMIKIYEVLKRAGKTKEADDRIAAWLKDNPNDAQSRLHLGSAYVVAKQSKAAIAQFEDVLKLQPKNVVALNNLAYLYYEQKNGPALEYAERAHQLAPDNPAVLDTLGFILVDQGNTVRGLPLLQKAAGMAPGSMDIRYHLAFGFFKSGDKLNAKKELEQLLAANKPFPRLDDAKALLKQLQL